MKIKQRNDDFRVRELLAAGVLVESGDWRVYRVSKRKSTSLEAAAELAGAAGVSAAEVSLAGLKDRQGVTVQHMAIARGKEVNLSSRELRIQSIGFSHSELTSESSLGNAFEIVVRALAQREVAVMRLNLPLVREQGVINYFDDQRFGNLRHGQGWIAAHLMRGEHELALQALLVSRSDHDDVRSQSFKRKVREHWGDWVECREAAGRFGEHHSIFEHLKKNPTDFAGAFYHVASRVRLIHLYAFQSHLWNRAVSELVREISTAEQRAMVDSEEGVLVHPATALPFPAEVGQSLRLPGPRFEDVDSPRERELLATALARHDLTPERFVIEGVSGFQLKGEERELIVRPMHLRVRPPEPDEENRGLSSIKVRFELPRGAYATLVVRRLFARAVEEQLAGGSETGEDRPRSRGRASQERPTSRFASEDAPRPRRFDRERGPRFERRPPRGRNLDRGPASESGAEGETPIRRRTWHGEEVERHLKEQGIEPGQWQPPEKARPYHPRGRDAGPRRDDARRGGRYGSPRPEGAGGAGRSGYGTNRPREGERGERFRDQRDRDDRPRGRGRPTGAWRPDERGPREGYGRAAGRPAHGRTRDDGPRSYGGSRPDAHGGRGGTDRPWWSSRGRSFEQRPAADRRSGDRTERPSGSGGFRPRGNSRYRPGDRGPRRESGGDDRAAGDSRARPRSGPRPRGGPRPRPRERD